MAPRMRPVGLNSVQLVSVLLQRTVINFCDPDFHFFKQWKLRSVQFAAFLDRVHYPSMY